MTLHILRTEGEWTEWQDCDWTGVKVIVSCCNRLEEPEHTEMRRFNEVLEYPDGEPTAAAYMGPMPPEFRCKQGFGCTVNPGMKRTAHLREDWYHWEE